MVYYFIRLNGKVIVKDIILGNLLIFLAPNLVQEFESGIFSNIKDVNVSAEVSFFDAEEKKDKINVAEVIQKAINIT